MSLNQEAVKVAAEASGIISNVETLSNSVYADIIGGAAVLGDQGWWKESVLGQHGANFSNVTTVGINEESIPSMKAAVNQYIDALNQHLDQVKQDADTSQAFKGEYAVAIREFVDAVCLSCRYIISNLQAFNDDLDLVMAAYHEKDTSMAGDLSSTAAGVEGSFTEYTSGK